MLEYFLTFTILLAAAFAYQCLIRPKAKLSNIARQFEAKGYKVFKIPYKCMAAPVFDHYNEGKNTDDPDGSMIWMKREYPKYDVVVSNVLTDPLVEIINPELVRDFYSQDNVYAFPKKRAVVDPVYRLIVMGSFSVRELLGREKEEF